MCGQLRLCSANNSNGNNGGRRPKPIMDDTGKQISNEITTIIIPRQNKGVCTVCDVAVWVVKDRDNLEIKWCKGCKNFRPWAAFGDKGLATKCVRCRKRQKEKYATQKNSSRITYETDRDDSIEYPSNIVAADGLRKLMKSSKF
jgi:hypothetical protein